MVINSTVIKIDSQMWQLIFLFHYSVFTTLDFDWPVINTSYQLANQGCCL